MTEENQGKKYRDRGGEEEKGGEKRGQRSDSKCAAKGRENGKLETGR